LLPFTRETFSEFLVRAKLKTYAAEGDDALVEPALRGARQLEYREPPFFYRDVYFGAAFFVGQEVVYLESDPVWSMSYAGGVTHSYNNPADLERIYGFLREALLLVQPDRPFRGPKRFSNTGLYYEDMSQGTVESFWGYEVIREGVTAAYELRYNGGMLR
jgi:hypothetical protein